MAWNSTEDWNASVPPAFDEITSGVANVTFNDTEGTDFAGAGADGHDGGADGDKSCRVCGQEGHFARECPEKPAFACFNCGDPSHAKADCPNPAVDRPFTGECRFCHAEGHRAIDCPDKPQKRCRQCLQEGHDAAECTEARALEYAGVPDMSTEDAWKMVIKASKERDIDDFKLGVRAYLKADRTTTFADIESKSRAADLSVYLIAQEKELPKGMTSVNPQGVQDRKYVVGYYFSPKPKRAKFAEGWPSSPEENLDRLKADTGVPAEHVLDLCRRCGELGHIAKNCDQEPEESAKPTIHCSNCEADTHRLRDCPEPRKTRGGPMVCKNCQQEGHKAADCTEPRSAAGVTCNACQEVGHFSRDCPTRGEGGGGGVKTCRNCGSPDHIAKECDQPKNPANTQCRNCDQMGHFSRDCPEPKNWAKVQCNQCSEFGHTVARCPNPPAETDGGNGDAGFDAGAGGGDDFNSAPPAADFGSGGAGGDQSWNTADAAAGGW